MGKYEEFVKSKAYADSPSGFEFPEINLNHGLFDFQRSIVSWALTRGRAAIFADTGLGKTIMQCEWAKQVCRHTGRNVLILAPLAVAHQTVNEARKFGINVAYSRDEITPGITITNYEMFDRFDVDDIVGIVLDESSILKHHTSKTRTKLIKACRGVPYKLSCTATPSPNDHMELGNQAEFLNIMSRSEMLAMFFVHDGGETQKWRLKGHGKQKFWKWLATWAILMRKPQDIGFPGQSFNLPPLRIHEHVVVSDSPFGNELFPKVAQTLNEQRKAQRSSLLDRVDELAGLVNGSSNRWIIWCHLNDESTALTDCIPDSVEVTGIDSFDRKERLLNEFSDGLHRVLVSKPSICGFGMNWQHTHKVAFVGLSHSFEQFYQAIRRCWRFGQTCQVDVHLFTAESEGQVLASIKRKERQHEELSIEMISEMVSFQDHLKKRAKVEKQDHTTDIMHGTGWEMRLGDCVQECATIEDEIIDYTIFSPPFSSLYTYSNSDYDMGNCRDDHEFISQFSFLVSELLRVTKPGRLCSFHCMNLPTSKQNDGFIGLKDFRGELIKLFQTIGWIYHSEVVIWKDPVVQMQRTKALGLLHKQLKKDSSMSRQGLADYLITMRKPGDNPKRVAHTDESFPVSLWQKYASPVWNDINPSNTLQFRHAREDKDERHIAPLQLEVIERALGIWTSQDDVVFSPFAGIGSEGYVALNMGRRFIGIELKPSYWKVACDNLHDATKQQSLLI